MATTPNVINFPPTFSPHRLGLLAADGAVSTKKAEGCNAKGFRWAILDFVLENTVTDLDIIVMFWSDAADSFVVSNDSQHTITNKTASYRAVVPVYGQTFWVRVTAFAGTNEVVSVYVAGFSEPAAH